MKTERVEADVLCVGGGIAGLMAAIRASELGAKVIVAEKGNTARSGEARAGNDHFWCYIPEVHGTDIESFIQECLLTQLGLFVLGFGPHVLRTWMEKSFDIVKLWDSWGIPMKYNGRWEFAGHSFPGRLLTHLKYAGQNQKPILTREALRRGTQIMNRIMVIELLGDSNGVIGALGIDTREERLIEFQVKTLFLGTGAVARLFPNLTPGLIGNQIRPITLSGDGRAMAYRLGADLADPESLNRHVGPKNFSRCGQATWVGILKDGQGKPVGTFVTKPDRKYGDMASEMGKTIPEQYTRSGRGPVYMDCTEMTAEDYEYMTHWMKHEGMVPILDHMDEEGMDVRKNPVEFTTYQMRCGGLIMINTRAETNIKGLYAAGDEAIGAISGAATFGWISGENAANYAQGIKATDIKKVRAKIDEKKELFAQLRGRQDGPDWEETNVALQQVMYDYCGSVRYESLLEQGLSHLRRIKDKACNTMMARNPHELGRCLETLNLLDLGELAFLMASDRKETRGLHHRPDYPITNPLMSGYHIIQNVQGKPTIWWKDLKR